MSNHRGSLGYLELTKHSAVLEDFLAADHCPGGNLPPVIPFGRKRVSMSVNDASDLAMTSLNNQRRRNGKTWRKVGKLNLDGTVVPINPICRDGKSFTTTSVDGRICATNGSLVRRFGTSSNNLVMKSITMVVTNVTHP